MTKREAAIVAAYTGYKLGDFDEMHKYIEEKMGHGVMTHMLGDKKFMNKLQAKCKSDFASLDVK